LVKVNADDNPDLSICYEVESIPTLLFFLEGQLAAKIVGTVSKEAILARLRAVLDCGEAAS
jgi:thioredoxin 1